MIKHPILIGPAQSRKRLPAILLLCMVFLISCVNTPEQRPQSVIDAESYLQQGTRAYYNDDYATAAKHFSRALELYQSIDNQQGMLNSYTNLAETAIAIGNFTLAQKQLDKISSLGNHSGDLAGSNRIALLRVKLLFNQQDYAAALAELKPLLPGFNEQQRPAKMDKGTLNSIASMARISVITDAPDADLWLQRLQQALQHNNDSNQRYQALVLRLQARQQQRAGELENSSQLLKQALATYRQLAYRRGIAASLQQMAELELMQQQWQAADDLLQRALNIHLWTLNHRQALQVMQQLIDINTQLGNMDKAQEYAEQLKRIKPGVQ